MIEDYKIYIDKYEWYESGSGTITPTKFRFNSTSPHLEFEHGLTDCVNINYYGNTTKAFEINEIDDSEMLPIQVAPYNQNYDVILINRAYTTITIQDVYNAFVSYYDSSYISASLTGNPTAEILDYNIWEQFTIPSAIGSGIESIVDVNFFSNASTPVLKETLYINDYIINIGDLSFSFDNTEIENNIPALYFEDSDVNFNLSGIQNNSYLYEFFGINEDTTYIKYMVRIYDLDDNPIFKGVVNQDTVEEGFSPSDNSEIITFNALGFLKEFKQYYSKKILPDEGTIAWYGNDTQTLYYILKVILFTHPSINIELENSLQDYMVNNYGVLSKDRKSTTNDWLFIKTGYYDAEKQKENCFDYLKKLSMAMGWVFYFNNNTLYIRNRSSQNTETLQLDYNKFIEYTVKKTDRVVYDAILIKDGNMYGGADTVLYNIGANKFYMINKDGVENVNVEWDSFDLYGHYPRVNKGHKYIREVSDDNNYYKYDLVTCVYPTPYQQWQYETKVINKQDILIIDGGKTEPYGYKYEQNNGYTSRLSGSFDLTQNPSYITFYGNYGNMLTKQTNVNEWFTYPDYVKSKAFTNNFAKYFQIKTGNKLEIIYDGIIGNMFNDVEIINNEIYDGLKYGINNIKYDLNENITTIELQEKDI